jgi:SARP family transcriptional regulator, regulator of embCAB operon
VEGDGAPVDLSPLRPRVRSVLQYLALHADAYVHRDVLAAVLWPESDLETGRRGVQVAVSALRSLLQPGQPRQSTLLPRRGDAYALALAGHGSSDVVEFDAQLVRAPRARATGDTGTAVAAWREVARLYRGELLLEQGNAEWVVAERDRLRLAAADALDALGTHLIEADDLVETDGVMEGVAALRRALELDPFRDGTWRTLAETHEAFGDRSAAAAVRLRHRRVLEDLGVLDEPLPRAEPRPEPLGSWTGARLR